MLFQGGDSPLSAISRSSSFSPSFGNRFWNWLAKHQEYGRGELLGVGEEPDQRQVDGLLAVAGEPGRFQQWDPVEAEPLDTEK